MRTITNINRKWAFTKQTTEIPSAIDTKWDFVSLPHTWNALDGQDGGNDYYRGTAIYSKELDKEELPEADRYYIEIQGANSSADLYVNGKKLMHYDGGYSTWRCDITEEIGVKTMIVLAVDNAPNDTVYPQMADFTFYGGIYRDVNLICVSKSHFDLDYYGGPGLKVTPTVEGENAKVEIETWVSDSKEGQTIRYTVTSRCGCKTFDVETAETKATLEIPNVHLWHGRKDPYLYTAKVELLENGEVIDCVSTRFLMFLSFFRVSTT